MRVFFSVGEPSGDIHGANLVRSLRQKGYRCEGYGGPRMQEQGFHVLEDLTQYAVMFLKALACIPKLWKLYQRADRLLASGQYDAVVLIDYPGFNWWIAKAAKRHGVPVFYYGVPQMWAWLPGRVRKLKRLVDHVLCKLPFEQSWFEQRGCQAIYVGHPYFDELADRKLDREFLREYASSTHPLLTLLPGSRTHEVHSNLEWLVESALRIRKQHPRTSIAIAAFNYRQAEYIRDFLEPYQLPIDVFVNRTPELIESATLCLACSGSVSLELMYHQKPSIIVYRLKPWQATVMPLVMRCRFITLVNLLATDNIELTPDWNYDPRAAVASVPFPEFPWLKSPVKHVAEIANQWLSNPSILQERRSQLQTLKQLYGQPGATTRAAEYIDQVLRDKKVKEQPANSPLDSSPTRQCKPVDEVCCDSLVLPATTSEDQEWNPADWQPAAMAAYRHAQRLAGSTDQLESDPVLYPFAAQADIASESRPESSQTYRRVA